MKWKEYVVIAGCLALSNLTPAISWGQVQLQPAPTDGKAFVQGSVQDAVTKSPVVGATIMAKSQDGMIKAQQFTDASGKFRLNLTAKQTYILVIQANGYDLHDESLSFTSDRVNTLTMRPKLLYRTGTTPVSQPAQPSTTVATSTEVNLPTTTVIAPPSALSGTDASNARVAPPKTLDAKVMYTPPLVVAPVGKTTQLKAIQFVQSKSELLPDAMPALEQLLAFMQGKPTAEIELSGHTDNQGNFDENLRLSKQRVDVVKAYLVQNGIEANRITTRGYGPTRPIASNNSESSRQLNRRVEMIVLKQ
ncbi:OmpA family protein [Spirosoma validum]|uniref:OmpA family protein n=1 Tax=Spirosoma validum TaxID=2771355 RepID=A0A927GDD6_9BACT|nr:OmpA family protein [Spirosoma validum]MBD2753563.1 OmpA family protein [Spirosoma validum]